MKLTLRIAEDIYIDTPSGQSLIIRCDGEGRPVVLETSLELSEKEKRLIDVEDRIIRAIKSYRERTGASLQVAKAAVEAYRNRPGPDYFDAVREDS